MGDRVEVRNSRENVVCWARVECCERSSSVVVEALVAVAAVVRGDFRSEGVGRRGWWGGSVKELRDTGRVGEWFGG